MALLLCASLIACSGEQDTVELVAQAKASIAEGDTQAAVIHFKNAIAADPDNADLRYKLGKLYLDTQDPASAEKELKRARKSGYDASIIDPLLAQSILEQGEFQRVLDEFPLPESGTPDRALLVARANAELSLKDTIAAQRTLDTAIKLDASHPEVRLALARLAMSKREFPAALQQAEQAIKARPDYLDAWLIKGDLLRLLGQTEAATAAYRAALKIDDTSAGARLALAGIALNAQRLDEAQAQVAAVLKKYPAHLQGRYTQALISFRAQKTELARDQLAGVLKGAPDFALANILSASIEYALGNLQTAEAQLNKYLKVAPNNLYAVRLLAATQLRLGHLDDAARTLAPLMKRDELRDPGSLILAGEIARTQKNYPQATAYFERAAQLNPDSATIRTELGLSRLAQGDSRALADLQSASAMEDGSRAHTLIILTHLARKNFTAALASIDDLDKKQGVSPASLNYRGAAYLGQNDRAKARASFSRALELDPGFYPAASNLAQLDVQDKQPGRARARYESILKATPNHLNAMLALAGLRKSAADEKGFLAWLDKAASAHPKAIEPRVALARYYLDKGDPGKALAMAREAVNAEPGHLGALETLGAVQLVSGDTANALASYRKLVELQPDNPTLKLKLARTQLAAKDQEGARKTLQEALRKQPDFVDGKILLGSIEIQRVQYDAALRLAGEIQKQHPRNPAGHVLEGEAAFARKNYAAALSAYERAHAVSPSGNWLARQLVMLNALQRGAEGERRIADWLTKHRDDLGLRAVLADNLIKRSQYKAAAGHYLTLNKQKPGDLMVLNNLAYTLFESGDRRAAGYAAEALKLQPDNPAVLDTYGWILTRSGKYAEGLASLKKAQAKAPDAPEIHWHLAYALHASGDKARARQELKTLLGRNMAFAAEPDARKLYQQLTTMP